MNRMPFYRFPIKPFCYSFNVYTSNIVLSAKCFNLQYFLLNSIHHQLVIILVQTKINVLFILIHFVQNIASLSPFE